MRRFKRSSQNQQDASTPQMVVGTDDFQQQTEALIPAEVCMISGCHSSQTSADVSNVSTVAQLPNPAGRAGGACTSALLEIVYRDKNITLQDLLLKLRTSLQQKGMTQIPQLTSSRPLDLEKKPFSLFNSNSTTGCRRALLVGINYRGQSGQLSGCVNDVFNMKQYIMNEQRYPDQNITVLVDDGHHEYPTRKRIIDALRHLVASSIAGDYIYFHYSGHGGLLSPQGNAYKNNNNDHDETLYPLDHERSGQIRDFSLFNHFVKPLAAGVTAFCCMDCCHSGAVLDLPYSFQPTPTGTIRCRQSMGSLNNLAFLYILAGGILPPGMNGVSQNLEEIVGNVDGYQGTGLDNMEEANEFDEGHFQDAGTEVENPVYGEASDTAVLDTTLQGELVDVEGINPNLLGEYNVVQGVDTDAGLYNGGCTDVVQGVEVPDSQISPDGYGDVFGGHYREVVDGDMGDSSSVDPGGDCGCISDALEGLLNQDFDF